MKDRFFKSEITSSFSTMPCNYNGTTDLYPKRNRNLMNNENSTEAAIKIQRCWRSRGFRSLVTAQKQVELEKTYILERFWSWFPF